MKIKDNFKESISKIKNSKIVKEAIKKLYPTFNIIKEKGGYKIVLMSLLVTLVLMPLQLLIELISKLILGTRIITGISFSSYRYIKDIMEYSSSKFVEKLILVIIITSLIGLVSFIITTFILGNGNLRAFKILAEEERVVDIGEYIKLSIKDILPFALKYFLNVTVPIIVINIAGVIVDFIPFIRGINIAYVITTMGIYALQFRFYAIMLDLKDDNIISKYAEYWLTYAVVVYLLKMVISISILNSLMNVVFVLYSVLILTKSKYYFGQEKDLLNRTENTN